MSNFAAGMTKPDYIFSVSWEVCNKVGGIYTVLSTQAKTLMAESGATVVFIGPDLCRGRENPLFIEDTALYPDWIRSFMETDHIKVRMGRWNIPGKPMVMLLDFSCCYENRNWIYSRGWDLFKVDSLHAYGDYDEASMFSFAAALAVRSFYNYAIGPNYSVVYHAHEWMTGLGALMIKHFVPQIATVFTTHATSIGRSICGNGKQLYRYFEGYHGDQMAQELNMESKHSIEKQTAHGVDCFTTVSDITAKECTQLLEITPHVVTKNGFENSFVPSKRYFAAKRANARKTILKVANTLFGTNWADETQIVGIGGRCEFHNKGIDLFLDSLRNLRDSGMAEGHHVLALVNVPAWVMEPRKDLMEALQSGGSAQPLHSPFITHWLHNMTDDSIVSTLVCNGWGTGQSDNVKVMFVPCYLDGNDGIFQKSYYDLLIGQDLAVYPSYYEPWGYTPLESAAFHVPTVTSDLAGFGLWVNSEIGRNAGLTDGVAVVHRDDCNWNEASDHIRDIMADWLPMDETRREAVRDAASKLASKALWKHFIGSYLEAYDIALKASARRASGN